MAMNKKSPTIKRILREAAELAQSPSPDYHAAPASDADLFDWHFTVRGPSDSPFANGIYHGRILLPPTYPLRPPMFRFLTPSGRFSLNTDICLSISGHHEESWQPAWGIRTAVVALRAFMETSPNGQMGGLDSSKEAREKMAEYSASWKCPVCARSNGEILAESGEEAKLKGEEDKEVEVPKELKMALKSELTREKETDSDAELAEGFVKTSTSVGLDGSADASSRSSSSYPAARPGQGVPQPTTAASNPTRNPSTNSNMNPPQTTARARLPPTAARQIQIDRHSRDGVPVWIDRTIAGVVVCLVAMIVKVVLGL